VINGGVVGSLNWCLERSESVASAVVCRDAPYGGTVAVRSRSVCHLQPIGVFAGEGEKKVRGRSRRVHQHLVGSLASKGTAPGVDEA